MVEQPNTDFAFTIGRQFLFDAFHLLLLEGLTQSNDERIAAIATKSLKEVKYHVRFSSSWIKRLGEGTEVSHEKIQTAMNTLWPYTSELFAESETEAEMRGLGIGVDLEEIRADYLAMIQPILQEAQLTLPKLQGHQKGGKSGMHTEHLGYILADLQYMQRAYPNMTW